MAVTTALSAAATLVLGALAGVSAPLPDFGHLDLDPLDRFREPPLQLEITRRSGPIMIMVDYEIAQDDLREFLELMRQRRRIRRRDGVQQWTLLSDLENPDIWTETYHVPTWVEYVRHHERSTQSDADVSDRLLALHKGPKPVAVHRMIKRHRISEFHDLPRKVAPGAR